MPTPSRTRAETRGRRRYDSPRRTQQAAATRDAVLAAARELFGERGWAATGMRDVAGHAGVAVETVYANFRSKSELLLAVIDVEVVGDTQPTPLADRPEFAALSVGSLEERARAAAHLLRGIFERSHALERALREAAYGNAELAQRERDAEERRRADVGRGMAAVAGRPVDDTERDGFWAIGSAQVYDLLVAGSGWTPQQYEDWLARTIAQLVTTPKDRA